MKLHLTINKLFSWRFIILLAILSTFNIYTALSQNFGYFASAVNLSVNGNQQYFNTYPGTLGPNSINPATGAPFLTGDLGTFTANSGLLNLKGGEIKTYKNSGGNVCGGALFYRIYKTGDPAPPFAQIVLPFFSNCAGSAFPDPGAGPCSGNDQKWGTFTESLDLTQRCSGNYTFEIFYTVTGSSSGGGCGDTVYDSNSGNNYKATFTISSDLQVTATANSSVCAGAALNLNASVTGGNPSFAYSWTGPAGYSSTDASPVLTGVQGTASGTYTVLVTDGCNDTFSAQTNVTVNPIPDNITASVVHPTCTETTGTISITAPASGVSYSFNDGGSYSSGSTSASLDPGNYQTRVKDDITGCESEPVTFTVNDSLLVPVASPSSNSPQCSGSNIQLVASDAGVGALYSWTGPDGFSSTDQNPSVTYSSAAIGSYTLTVTSTDGCKSAATTDVSCSALPFKLVSFRGQALENSVQLNWEAVEASNFSHFEIERSSNAKSFEVIKKVDYDYSKQLYSDTDVTPLYGINYYRLNMVDMDGTHAYSKAIGIKYNNVGSEYAFLENPGRTNQIHLFTNLKPVSVELIDVSGKEISLKFARVTEKEWIIHAEEVAENRISLFRINGERRSLTRKFIKTR